MAVSKKLTLPLQLQESAREYAERPSVSYVGQEPITYREFYDQVQKVAAVLHQYGFKKKDKIAILSENMPNWGIAYFSILYIGAIVVPILPDFHANIVQHILRHSDSKAIFISKKLYEKVEDFQFEQLQKVFLIDAFQEIPLNTLKQNLNTYLKKGQKKLIQFRDAAMRFVGIPPQPVEEDDIAIIIYTSGTTGNSKGVMLTHRNILFDARETLKIQPVCSNDRLLSILPLSHTYENTIGFIIPIIQGASIYYLDKIPTARILLPAMASIKPTMMLSVPLVIEKIYKTKILPQFHQHGLVRILYKIPLFRRLFHRLAGKKMIHSFGGKLHFFGIGGAKLSAEVERFLREAKFPYSIGYGLTETSPLIAGSSPDKTKFQSTGFILPDLKVIIRKEKADSKEGEILVKGDNVMKGYYKDPDRTKLAFTEDGWFRTGDLGMIDRKGYLFIKGRSKNMIVGASGENIYPEEIENLINRNDLVLESLVYDNQGILTAKVHLNTEELDRDFARHKLNDYAIQEKIETILQTIRKETNSLLSSYAKIQKMIFQPYPFEKTPTKKIKRFLYFD